MAAASRSNWRERHAENSDRAARAGPPSRAHSIWQNLAQKPGRCLDARLGNVVARFMGPPRRGS
jgi:hypothetical protein